MMIGADDRCPDFWLFSRCARTAVLSSFRLSLCLLPWNVGDDDLTRLGPGGVLENLFAGQ